MTGIGQYLIQQDATLGMGVIKYQRTDGRYAVDVHGKTRIVRSAVAGLTPGRRVVVSKVNGNWYVTDGLESFENTRTTTVIVNV